jgi:hypothetical protein
MLVTPDGALKTSSPLVVYVQELVKPEDEKTPLSPHGPQLITISGVPVASSLIEVAVAVATQKLDPAPPPPAKVPAPPPPPP